MRRTTPAVRPAGPAVFLVVGVAYLAVAQIVISLDDPVSVGAGLWPGAGISLGALLLLPTRSWSWALAGVAVAELGGDLARGYPWPASLCWMLGNTLEPLLGAWLLRRFGSAAGGLAPLRQMMLFLGFGVVLGPLVGAVGSLGAVWSTGASPFAVWPQYFVGDALGVLVVAPVLVTWRATAPLRSRVETVALAVGAVLTALLVFGDRGRSWDGDLPYLLVPFFTWAALRFDVRGTARLALVVTLIANLLTVAGAGPFASEGATAGSVALLQLFMAITVSTSLVLAAVAGQLSDRHQVEAALRHQAFHDVLTGLPNRASFTAALDRVLAGHRDGDGDGSSRPALVLIDIDHLKDVNDSIGHRAGDELLVCIAARLRDSVTPGDLVARISGDEFVVLVEGTDDREVAALCRRIMSAVSRPVFLTAGRRAVPSVSVGAAVGEASDTPGTLFNNADAALYEAKRLGRGRTVHVDEPLRLRCQERVRIESELPLALGAGHIGCLHQPEIELATGTVFAFESLARWTHPTRGVITPDRFLPAVESAGLAGGLFETVLAQSLAAQRDWAAVLGFRPAISVNLSALQLSDPHLPDIVGTALARAGASADTLWLELTETRSAELAALEGTLTALTGLGAHMAIDDFGTGWSSMSRLSRYPWEALKIDRSFIALLGRDPGAEHLVRAMIAMARALGIRTVGEGVETPEQLARLTDLGCDIAQGFLFSRPVDARAAVDMVDRHGRWVAPRAGVPVPTP